MTGRRRHASRQASGDPIDRRAMADFEARFDQPTFAPVVVVIAAYQEEPTIGAVLDAIPARCCGLAIDTLVVVDGATDATAGLARDRGVYVCVCDVNRGQGAALRLGYALARRHGARFVVTTDADGQYDLSQLGRLLDPLVTDRADFVTGSRWLGDQATTDRMRRAGSRFFAWVTSVLTGQKTTDTSFGFRAMKADLTGAVTLRQPQYQSAELLMEVLARGDRVVEVPMTMRARPAGETKKGTNLTYGARYAAVLLGTWCRHWRRWTCRWTSGKQRPRAAGALTRRRRVR
jgi:glycosyltransferase involved in cell wall biosynthesis